MAKVCVYLRTCCALPDGARALPYVRGRRAPLLGASHFLALCQPRSFLYMGYTACSLILCRALNSVAEVGVITPFYSWRNRASER